MEIPCYVLNCNENSETTKGKYSNICRIHYDQRQKVLNILLKAINCVNTFSEIFDNRVKGFLDRIISSAKKTSNVFEEVNKKLKDYMKNLFINKTKNSKESFFERILDISQIEFENKIKKLDEFRADQYFQIFEDFRKFDTELGMISKTFEIYADEVNKIGNFFSSLKIDQDKSSNYISFIRERNNRNDLLRFCRTDGKIIQYNLNLDKHVNYPAVCDLPGTKVLICGGKYSKFKYSSNCYIFDSDSCDLISVAPTEDLNVQSGCIYFQEFCYFFGGRKNKISTHNAKKYSIKKNIWSSICDLPCETSIHNPTFFNGAIWMSGYLYEHIFYYDPFDDCYFRVAFEELNERKFLLKFKDKLYILSDSRVYLVVGNTFQLICTTFAISVVKSIETNDSIVFHDGSWIYNFSPSDRKIFVLEKFSFNPVKPYK